VRAPLLGGMTTAAERISLGRYGEALAARRLVDDGMVLLDRNWRCPAGEIDLVLRDGDTLVVCEVKTRRTLAQGHPFEAVTPKKANRLRRLAAAWLSDHDVHAADVRIDMVGIVRPARGDAVVEHVRGIG